MVRISCLFAVFFLGVLLLAIPASAYPRMPSNYYLEDNYEPEEIMDMLNRLDNYLQQERKIANEKRALDLGLNRGYSGAVHAKHMMGLAAANFAGGPGRKRRDAH
ncbi:diuretic hormone class 2 [Pieris rapae]|uniref:diuretic hormone class 2 n=1 Tax=Pieris rapae TaxID=64459 RepID=UPI000B92CEA1|nr:diuretic hormone class 2 [Pieris rapae]